MCTLQNSYFTSGLSLSWLWECLFLLLSATLVHTKIIRRSGLSMARGHSQDTAQAVAASNHAHPHPCEESKPRWLLHTLQLLMCCELIPPFIQKSRGLAKDCPSTQTCISSAAFSKCSGTHSSSRPRPPLKQILHNAILQTFLHKNEEQKLIA